MSTVGSEEDAANHAPLEDPHAYDYVPFSADPPRLYRKQVMARSGAVGLCFLSLLFTFLVQVVPLAQLQHGAPEDGGTSVDTYYLWSFSGVEDESKGSVDSEMLPVQMFMVLALVLAVITMMLGVMFVVCRVSHERKRNLEDGEREVARQEYLDHLARVEMRKQRALTRGDDFDDVVDFELDSGNSSEISFGGDIELDEEEEKSEVADVDSDMDRASSTAAYEEREPAAFYETAERHRLRIDRNIAVLLLCVIVMLLIATLVGIVSFAVFYAAGIATGKGEKEESASYMGGFTVMIIALATTFLMGALVAFYPFTGRNVLATPVAPGQVDDEMMDLGMLADHTSETMPLQGCAASPACNPLVKKPGSRGPQTGLYVCNASDVSEHDERNTTGTMPVTGQAAVATDKEREK